MAVKKGDTVKVHYTLKLDNGSIIDTSIGKDPLEFEVGGGKLIKGFDEAVLGMEKDDVKDVKLKPEDAYGERNEELKKEMPIEGFKKQSGKDPEIGMVLQFKKEGFLAQGVVTKVEGENMIIDLNHPLAGKELSFNIKIVEVKSS